MNAKRPILSGIAKSTLLVKSSASNHSGASSGHSRGPSVDSGYSQRSSRSDNRDQSLCTLSRTKRPSIGGEILIIEESHGWGHFVDL